MPGSRLLPAEQRSTLPAAPTTSRWWRAHVLVRSWLNRHRQRWLAPLLVCVPPIGVAMVWAGASRPGHQRRWLTAAAGVWMIALGLMVSLLALPGASPADAGGAPVRAGGAAIPTASPSATPTRDTAASASVVRRAQVAAGGVASASVSSAPPTEGGSGSGSGADGNGSGSGSDERPASTGPAVDAPASTPRRATPATTPRPHVTPTPTAVPTKDTKPPRPPRTTPTVPTAMPFTSCSSEGAHAVSPNGFPLRCYRTPIGLFWLWGR